MSTMTLSSTARSENKSTAFGQMVMWAVNFYDMMAERVRQRRALAGLSDELLKDIGLSRADVYGECQKKFWQA